MRADDGGGGRSERGRTRENRDERDENSGDLAAAAAVTGNGSGLVAVVEEREDCLAGERACGKKKN